MSVARWMFFSCLIGCGTNVIDENGSRESAYTEPSTALAQVAVRLLKFGNTVAASPDQRLLAVGAHESTVGGFSSAGAVYLFDLRNLRAAPSRLTSPQPTHDDFFGSSCRFYGNTLAVSAPGSNTVWLFELKNGESGVRYNARQIQDIKGLEKSAPSSLGINNEYLAIGAPRDRGGIVYVLKWRHLPTRSRLSDFEPLVLKSRPDKNSSAAQDIRRDPVIEPSLKGRLSDDSEDLPHSAFGFALDIRGSQVLIGNPGGGGYASIIDIEPSDEGCNEQVNRRGEDGICTVRKTLRPPNANSGDLINRTNLDNEGRSQFGYSVAWSLTGDAGVGVVDSLNPFADVYIFKRDGKVPYSTYQIVDTDAPAGAKSIRFIDQVRMAISGCHDDCEYAAATVNRLSGSGPNEIVAVRSPSDRGYWERTDSNNTIFGDDIAVAEPYVFIGGSLSTQTPTVIPGGLVDTGVVLYFDLSKQQQQIKGPDYFNSEALSATEVY